MIRSLIKLLVVGVIAILGYNYFFGDTAEKANSKKIFGEVGTLFGSVKELVQSERGKYDAGKYDNAIGKVDNILGKLRSEATGNSGWIRKINDLEQQKNQIQQKIDRSKQSTNSGNSAEKDALKNDFSRMTDEINNLVQEMDK